MFNSSPPVAVPFGLHYQCGLTLDDAITALSMSGDGRLLAMAFASGKIELWDFDVDSPLTGLPRPYEPVAALALSQDGRLARCPSTGEIEFRDTDRRNQAAPGLKSGAGEPPCRGRQTGGS